MCLVQRHIDTAHEISSYIIIAQPSFIESHKKRKSKWDNPSSELKVASPSQSGSDPVVGAQALANARLIDKSLMKLFKQ